MSDETSTLTYDMVKTLKSSGTKITVDQCNAAIQNTAESLTALGTDLANASAEYAEARIAGFKSLKSVCGAHAATIVKDAIATGNVSGKTHATTKSPYPEDEEAKKSLEEKGKSIAKAFATIEHGVYSDEIEKTAKALAEVQAKIGDAMRHLSKLVSWRERIAMGLGD